MLPESEWEEMPILGLKIPQDVWTRSMVQDPSSAERLFDILRPEDAWRQADKTSDEYEQTAKQLAGSFQKNFEKYANMWKPERYEQLKAAGPKA